MIGQEVSSFFLQGGCYSKRKIRQVDSLTLFTNALIWIFSKSNTSLLNLNNVTILGRHLFNSKQTTYLSHFASSNSNL
ncbi:unnamed protein product [Paramecium sonneborni]|uniref:Uncharacterized protein n=1 Tax=Paramecium sonneborni TaxID=65129 RepID=A0A8S1P3C4_9CILI|nr:unnamed protein product [Paramecium sonneborni]